MRMPPSPGQRIGDKVMGHIGLNAHLLAGRAGYRSAGIHHYLAHLLRHLPEADPHLRYTLFVGPETDMTELSAPCPGAEGRGADRGWRVNRSRWPTQHPPLRILWEQTALPLAARGLDLLHGLAFVAPLLAPCPTLVTVYDLSFLRTPERFRRGNRWYLQMFTRWSCRRARRIIAISENTRRDLVALFGIPPERVDVVPPGVSPSFGPLPPDQVAAFRRAKGLPERFVLYLGTLEPRKNLITLLEAFARLRPGVKLVLAGGTGWMFAEVFARVQALGLEGKVVFPGYVPDEELPLWYNAATVFVYPSLYEGFGMPPLEALACGTPVVVSNASALPEAVGDAGVLVRPDAVDEWAQALERLLDDAALRAELGARGRAHAARFSWERAAAGTVAVYHRILEGRE
jgi:glycosyltransferase involved in cell wall biosynthesis